MYEATSAEQRQWRSGIDASSAAIPSTPGKLTILLVEDEEMVRKLICEVLEGAGYGVFPCALPAEGIETGRQHAGEIDLLLTDVVMPELNGREMAARIHEFLPGLPVIFMSGYARQALAEEGQVDPRFEYLQKPFTLRALSEKLKVVLGNQQD
jgi:two-component system cell cycle sensor histidine kinase/response regulator CckA